MYDDDRDALAAEYVLGTLAGDERDQAEALLAIDPGFAEIVRQWERRLGELNVMVEAVEPPPDVWEKIKSEIDGGAPRSEAAAAVPEADIQLPAFEEGAPQTAPEAAPEMTSEPGEPGGEFFLEAPQEFSPTEPPQDLEDLVPPQDLEESSPIAALASSLLPSEPEARPAKVPPTERPSPAPRIGRSADVITLARGVRRWRGMTVAMAAIAALLALYIGVSQFAPGLIPLGRQQQAVVAGRTPPAARLVAVLQHDPTAPAFLLTVDPQARTLTVRRVSVAAEASRSYELWLISSKLPAPRSLGVVGAQEFTARPIPASFDADTVRSASYAISLEPAGGSPSGAPTGPILFTGKLVDSVPGAPPS